jgi:hypothetical protein
MCTRPLSNGCLPPFSISAQAAQLALCVVSLIQGLLGWLGVDMRCDCCMIFQLLLLPPLLLLRMPAGLPALRWAAVSAWLHHP